MKRLPKLCIIFTCNQFNVNLTAKRSKDPQVKLEKLLKMSMLEDEDTETSMSESSTSTSDSESDDKYWKSHKKKGAEHCKQLSKTRKEKSTSRK